MIALSGNDLDDLALLSPRAREQTLYIVRHCKATGQQPEAPLTPAGLADAALLADQLAALPLDRIISSPFLRARQTIVPLAERLGLPIASDARLAERVNAAGHAWQPDDAAAEALRSANWLRGVAAADEPGCVSRCGCAGSGEDCASMAKLK
jgi:broad specificity phosphatase PhoE